MKLLFIFIFNFFIANNLLASSLTVISTTSGEVTGIRKNKVVLYEDIPYAQPPVLDLRWKAPREISKPAKIYPKDGNFCIQRPSGLGGVSSENFYVGSEDCLYLDIFTPSKNNIVSKLPVMFWIHGGGNTSGLKDLYDFSKMVSKHDVIVVRINYRLGPFGWFSHPAIQSLQHDIDKTSNFGTLDIIAALEWVQNNISKFGGDSDNVTIFGESAGGHNVLSLMVSKKANGLFHKAISMSGYTSSISARDAYDPIITSPTSEYSSKKVVKKLLNKFDINKYNGESILHKQRDMLLNVSAKDFFQIYAERAPFEEIPLLTSDGIVIPDIGLKEALSREEYVNIVPTIAGYNRDEVKLWLATAGYFVELDYSLVGSVLRIPKVKLSNEDSFEAFNYYRSSAWGIRGVDEPLRSLELAGNKNLYAYRYDWDDHRKFLVGNFKKLIGAAHATEIPLLTRNYDLVGGYPLSDIIYPPSISKRYTSKNMMLFWTNFAKFGDPGNSTNSVKWSEYSNLQGNPNYMIIDKRSKLKMYKQDISFKNLVNEIISDNRLNELEKCVVLLQMFTYVGDDLYEENIDKYTKKCSRDKSEEFIRNNSSVIEY